VLPSLLSQSTFGPTIDGAAARALPEFGFGGRTEFFVSDPPTFWLRGERSGLFPFEWNLTPLLPPQAYLPPLLLVCLISRGAFPAHPRSSTSGGGGYPYAAVRRGAHPGLYLFLQSQPTDTLVASIDEEVNNLPTFARRSILTGREYAIPFHLGFYLPFRERSLE